MSNRFFTEDHEWVELDGNNVTVGISSHAADELGEIVFVELPEAGTELSKGDEFGSVESVKTVSGIYSPVDGEVTERNESVIESPEQINQSPNEDGWLIKAKVESTSFIEDLMDDEAYQSFLNTL
ncbi:MAG: glycine cleavage system protein GcvH [Candidatus Margulisiibacteriota bacterium]|nr:glycine cleavage system protein GcvH [Candidatus Margulisiibacteriota bacterium]